MNVVVVVIAWMQFSYEVRVQKDSYKRIFHPSRGGIDTGREDV